MPAAAVNVPCVLRSASDVRNAHKRAGRLGARGAARNRTSIPAALQIPLGPRGRNFDPPPRVLLLQPLLVLVIRREGSPHAFFSVGADRGAPGPLAPVMVASAPGRRGAAPARILPYRHPPHALHNIATYPSEDHVVRCKPRAHQACCGASLLSRAPPHPSICQVSLPHSGPERWSAPM